jgi:hypothetical protein
MFRSFGLAELSMTTPGPSCSSAWMISPPSPGTTCNGEAEGAAEPADRGGRVAVDDEGEDGGGDDCGLGHWGDSFHTSPE